MKISEIKKIYSHYACDSGEESRFVTAEFGKFGKCVVIMTRSGIVGLHVVQIVQANTGKKLLDENRSRACDNAKFDAIGVAGEMLREREELNDESIH